jgi:signal transduction histidine kinase
MEKKGGTLNISLCNVTFDEPITGNLSKFPPGDYLRLSVCDSGKGIPEHIIKKIFDPYFTTKAEGKGAVWDLP